MDNNLFATVRETRGKCPARQLRMKDSIPAVFYFGSDKNLALTLDGPTFRGLLRQKPNFIALEVEGYDKQDCVIREIQRDPVTEKIVHVDFMGIREGQKVKVKVAVHLTGVPIGVKNSGGILQQNRTELEVECLPRDIERDIDIDVSALDITDSLLVEDLDFPNFKFLHPPKMSLATVMSTVKGSGGRERAHGKGPVTEKKGREGLTLKEMLAAEAAEAESEE